MYVHYLHISGRQLKNSRSAAAINLFGLAMAMAICLMIFLYVKHELSFDRFHENSENIYRIGLTIDIQGEIQKEPYSSPAIGPDLLEVFPEITGMVRLSNQTINIWQDDRFTSVQQSLYADNSFFELFSFPLLRGSKESALSEPFSLVITESLAERLFPGQNALGMMVRINDYDNRFTITGIAADCPKNSHIQFEALLSFATHLQGNRRNFTEWDANIAYYTYVLLSGDYDLESLTEKTAELTYEKINHKFEGMGVSIDLHYFPMVNIRLYSDYSGEMLENGTIRRVWLFSVIALFVLFIAGFNYVNLTIARSGKRAREIGMRKVLGAHKHMLRKQFYIETIFFTAISFLLALLFTEIALPAFNLILNIQLSLLETPWWFYLVAFLVFVGLFGFLAGIYPAWYMTSFEPVKILKGEFWSMPGRFQPRNLLLLIQFIVSMGLIVCTMVILLQIRFMQTKDYGFDYNNLLAVQVSNREDARLLKQAFEKYPWVTSQSLASGFPGGGTTYMEGIVPQDAEPGFMSYRVWVDQNYFNTLNLRLADGRFFESDGGLETGNVIINKTLARRAGWTESLGKTIERSGVTYRVSGIVDDFHYLSLHHVVEPILINVIDDMPAFLPSLWLLIRFENEASHLVTESLLKEWKEHFSANTLTYNYVSALVGAQYTEDRSFGRLFMAFTMLAIIIAMLGIMGLSSLAARQRQKETGIRKVLGASSKSLVLKMSLEYLKWIAISALVALPLAYWLMHRWLEGFAYAIDFPWWTMAVSLAGLTLTALLIVITQTWATTRVNPAEVLKTE